MNLRGYTVLILIVFCVAGVFGLYLPTMSHAGHEAGCIFAPGGIAICAAGLTHMEHWQSAFAAAIVELLILFTLVIVFFRSYDLFDPDVGRFASTLRLRRVPIRPPILQELYSAGILNRKEP